MQKFLKRFFACLTSLLVLTSFLALQAGADSSTLGTQSPAITAEYFTDAGLTSQVDGNALTSGESYYMVLSVSDLASISQFQLTATYDADLLTFGTVTVLPNGSTGFDAITPVAAGGRFVLGFVSTESEYTALADNTAVLAVAQITVASNLEADVDAADAITVNTNPNYTFIEVSYADIAYDQSGNRVYSCYGLATSEDFTGTVYTTMSVDFSPEVNFGYTVSAYVGYLEYTTSTAGKLGNKEKLQNVVITIEVNGETVTADYDNSTGQFTFTGVPDGTYTASLTYAYGLPRTFTIVVNGADVVSDTVIGVINCNFNSDKYVNAKDLSAFKPLSGKRKGSAEYTANFFMDINGDDYINAKDLTIFKRFSGKSTSNWKGNTPAQTVQNIAEN